MSFGPDHYVPVLKVKRGEKAALRTLAPAAASRVTPLLEIVERKPNKATLAKHFDTAFKDLATSVAAFPRCFLDVREMQSDDPAAAAQAFARASGAGIGFTPVTGITRTHDVAAALSWREQGLALRLTRGEFESGTLAATLARFLQTHQLAPEAIDLIIDLGAVESMISAGIAALTAAFLSTVPYHTRWRTFTVSGCAFPQSMGGVARHDHLFVDRSEWIAWRDDLHAARRGLARLPAFSDCAIQHPKGVEGFNPAIMQVSAAARYTSDDSWLLIKGESTRNTAPSAQFPAIAQRLTSPPLATFFKGASHCQGCQWMAAAAAGAPGLGSAEAWRRLGTLHHLETVVSDLRALAWP